MPTRSRRARIVDREVGRRIKEARVLLGVALKDLAAALGVSARVAADVEAGRRRLDPRLFPSLLKFLDIRLSDLFAEASLRRARPWSARRRDAK